MADPLSATAVLASVHNADAEARAARNAAMIKDKFSELFPAAIVALGAALTVLWSAGWLWLFVWLI